MEPQDSTHCYEFLDLPAKYPVPRWHLDMPVYAGRCESTGAGLLHLRGWILPDGERWKRYVGVSIRLNGITRAYPLNEQRGDVVAKLLNLEPRDYPDLRCGFNLNLREVAELEFGLDLDGVLVWLKHLRRTGGTTGPGNNGDRTHRQ